MCCALNLNFSVPSAEHQRLQGHEQRLGTKNDGVHERNGIHDMQIGSAEKILFGLNLFVMIGISVHDAA